MKFQTILLADDFCSSQVSSEAYQIQATKIEEEISENGKLNNLKQDKEELELLPVLH